MMRQNGNTTVNRRVLATFTLFYLTLSSLVFVFPFVEELENHHIIKRDENIMEPSEALVQWLDSIKADFTILDVHTEAIHTEAIKYNIEQNDNEAVKGSKDFNGDFHGWCRIDYKDGSYAQAKFRHGVLHGLFLRFQCKFGACNLYDSDHDWSQAQYLKEISVFVNGRRNGISYQFKTGGGFVVGIVDAQTGELTGQDIAYVYPDFQTMIVGNFENGTLISGQSAELVAIVQSKNGLMQVIPGPMNWDDEKFTYSPSNQTYIPFPLKRDPMEEKFIHVSASSLSSKAAGRGVFLKRNCSNGTLVGFYNGVRMTDLESKVKIEDRKSAYRMDNDWANPTEILNIPSKYRDLNLFNATLGHLVNHQTPPNCWFGMIDHPRFGKIRSLVLLRDMKAGEELFADYGYVENYISSEAAIKAIYRATQWWMDENDKDFHQNIKFHIRYMRKKVDQYKPYLNMLKSLTKKMF